MTPYAAQATYGVVLMNRNREVDSTATAALRRKMLPQASQPGERRP